MATSLWGQVYYNKHFAGILSEEPPGTATSFTYDASYISKGLPAIAHTLPLQEAPHRNEVDLFPFFDNLVAEGWLASAQTRLLGARNVSRFQLLLAFGYDCPGAVSIVDPTPEKLSRLLLDEHDDKEMATLKGRASISGVQPKLAVVERNKKYYPAHVNELSTYIAKFPSKDHPDLIFNEYLTTLAFKALLPNDTVAEVCISSVDEILEPALIIKRFDRSPEGRIHFEEFNQLLNHASFAKYDAAYKDMSTFIKGTPTCLPIDNYRLFCRILAGILMGNTDMHLKNFAMFHTQNGLYLTPSYDQVAVSLYPYHTIALAISGAKNLIIESLHAKKILLLGQEFGLPPDSIKMAVDQLAQHKEAAQQAIANASLPIALPNLKNNLIHLMEKRWNGTFALIGQLLSKKQ